MMEKIQNQNEVIDEIKRNSAHYMNQTFDEEIQKKIQQQVNDQIANLTKDKLSEEEKKSIISQFQAQMADKQKQYDLELEQMRKDLESVKSKNQTYINSLEELKNQRSREMFDEQLHIVKEQNEL